MVARAGLVAVIASGLVGCAAPEQGPLSPEQALESFRVATGFRVELFAAEPHVVDPVEMAFDENGGVYLAELGDNPDDPPAGQEPLSRIKYLEDTDGDGRIDRHTVFADGLLAVEGIAPWRGGLVATAAPDILYLKDTDGDRRADVREVMYTGFAVPHVEGRLSNPRLGLDNWFYVVNHGYPGSVTVPGNPSVPAVNVRKREFRFHPIRGLAEASTGDAQFGQSYNRWGHWFITHNTVHLRHTVVPPGYLDRNPLFAVEESEQDISDHGRPASPVYPISAPQRWRVERTRARSRRYAETRPGRVEQLAGFFTAAAGTTVYTGDRFGPDFEDAIFVGEGNGNLVHCDVATPDGATYTARRWPAQGEFLASSDNWFRPVNFANAPDGSLYVLDYYREFLEHPDFIPEAVKRRLGMDFRAGDTLGRIYRIVPAKEGWRPRPDRLGDFASEELVRLLGHSNGWHRRTAHRLLVERQDQGAVHSLEHNLTAHPDAAVRLRSLWVLEGLGSLTPELVESTLGDVHWAVREAALRLADPTLESLSGAVLDATRDENPRVAFQAGLTVGGLPVSGELAATLAGLVARFPDDPWFHVPVLSAPPAMAGPVLSALAEQYPAYFEAPSRERLRFVEQAARVVGARNDHAETVATLVTAATSDRLAGTAWRAAVLDGLADGLALHAGRIRSPQATASLGTLLSDDADAVRAGAARLAPYFDIGAEVGRARVAALDPEMPLNRRLEAASVLRAGTFDEIGQALAALVRDAPDAELRVRAVRVLGSLADSRAADVLAGAWDGSPEEVRDAIADSLMRRSEHAMALVTAVRDGRIRPADIAAVTRIRLSEHPNDAVRSVVAQHLDLQLRDRDLVLAERLAALDEQGDPVAGKPLFDRECASCHVARAARGRIGPDLSGVTNRSREDLLTSILDPSYAIEDRYRNYILETRDGRFHDGILVAETASTVTLRGEREDNSVLKRDIAELRTSEVSLMPEGFEDAFSDRDLADLIAYLQAGL